MPGKKTDKKPKASDLGTGAAAKAAKKGADRNSRTRKGADDALAAFRASLGTTRRD